MNDLGEISMWSPNIPKTLSDLQGHSAVASLSKWELSYKISTDIVRCTFPL